MSDKFCKVIETESTQILVKREYDAEEDVYSVSIETVLDDARVIVSPKLNKGATVEQQDSLFDKMVARAEQMKDDLIPAMLNIR